MTDKEIAGIIIASIFVVIITLQILDFFIGGDKQ